MMTYGLFLHFVLRFFFSELWPGFHELHWERRIADAGTEFRLEKFLFWVAQ